jgi:hypothetical protein
MTLAHHHSGRRHHAKHPGYGHSRRCQHFSQQHPRRRHLQRRLELHRSHRFTRDLHHDLSPVHRPFGNRNRIGLHLRHHGHHQVRTLQPGSPYSAALSTPPVASPVTSWRSTSRSHRHFFPGPACPSNRFPLYCLPICWRTAAPPISKARLAPTASPAAYLSSAIASLPPPPPPRPPAADAPASVEFVRISTARRTSEYRRIAGQGLRQEHLTASAVELRTSLVLGLRVRKAAIILA